MNSQDIILGMLMKNTLSGYDMKQNFEQLFSFFYDASYGTIYPTLSKMEAAGYITKEVVVQEGKPNKNMYSITEHGVKVFQAYLSSSLEADLLRSDLLMRLYFGEFTDKDTIMGWLEADIAEVSGMLNRLETNYEDWRKGMSPTQEFGFRIGIKSFKQRIQLLNEFAEQLKELK